MGNVIRREYPDQPVIGVGGIIFMDKSVLLVKRAQSPGKGQWSLPGGAVELGETLGEREKVGDWLEEFRPLSLWVRWRRLPTVSLARQ